MVDLTTQQIVWRRGMGPLQIGLPSTAGSFVTAGGLVFNAGVMDAKLRAIDVFTGEVVWQDALPGASEATPMTYVSPATARQYVIVTVPGARQAGPEAAHDATTDGAAAPAQTGRVIAYALPDANVE